MSGFTQEHDSSRQKIERRDTLLSYCKRLRITNLLATNYPGGIGRKFLINELKPAVRSLTLCERSRGGFISKDKYLSEVHGIKLVEGDVFEQLGFDKYDALDVDLCTGLSQQSLSIIESNTTLKLIFITMTDKFRDRWGRKAALPSKMNPLVFWESWCPLNGWDKPQLSYPLPYRRRIEDGRCPNYFTFALTRNA